MLTYNHGGHMVNKDSVYIFSKSVAAEELSNTYVTYQEKNQDSVTTFLNWNVVGWQTLKGKLFLVGENGETLFFDDSKKKQLEKIGKDCVFTGSTISFKGEIYAYGMSNCLTKTSDGVNWNDNNFSIDESSYGILDINCNDNGVCYCVCWNGDIYMKSQKNIWEDITSPVNTILTSCLVLKDGSFIACGREGVILQGKDELINVLDHTFKELHFWDVFECDGDVYIASTTTLFKLDDGKLSPVLGWPLPDSGVYASSMNTPKGFWIFTEKAIFSFSDGNFNEV